MPAKIFINYRRDDVAGDARGIREALAARFGKANVFMDVDNLLAGQRFDRELEKALAQCGVLISVIGPRWMDLLIAKAKSGERDYVREEIAVALKRGITVIPVRAGREGGLAPLPRPDALPADIRDLVLHQKQDVAHERFGRDITQLIESIDIIQNGGRPPVRWGRLAAALVAVLIAVGLGFGLSGLPIPGRTAHVDPTSPPAAPSSPAPMAPPHDHTAAPAPEPSQAALEIAAQKRQLVVAPLTSEDFVKGLSGRWQAQITCAGNKRYDVRLKVPGMAPGRVSLDAVRTLVAEDDPNRNAAIAQVIPGFVYNFFAPGVETWPDGYSSGEMEFQAFHEKTSTMTIMLNNDQSFLVLDDKSGLICDSNASSTARYRFIRVTQQ